MVIESCFRNIDQSHRAIVLDEGVDVGDGIESVLFGPEESRLKRSSKLGFIFKGRDLPFAFGSRYLDEESRSIVTENEVLQIAGRRNKISIEIIVIGSFFVFAGIEMNVVFVPVTENLRFIGFVHLSVFG